MDDLLADGPEKILEQVYLANYPWLEGYILRNSGVVSDAQDIFQEAVCAAWVNLREGRFSGSPEQFNAYLRQICKYKWFNHLKSAAYRKQDYSRDVSALEAADESGEELALQEQQNRQLKKCFEQLGERCRQVLGQFYYQRKSLAEIAAEQQNTEESIKTIKYRCMVRLRKLFIEQYKEDVQV